MSYRRLCDQCGYGYEYETRPKGGECYCSSACQNKAEEKAPVVTNKVIKTKARRLNKKIEALKREAFNVSVYLKDNGHGMASAHFQKIGDRLLKASEAAELLA